MDKAVLFYASHPSRLHISVKSWEMRLIIQLFIFCLFILISPSLCSTSLRMHTWAFLGAHSPCVCMGFHRTCLCMNVCFHACKIGHLMAAGIMISFFTRLSHLKSPRQEQHSGTFESIGKPWTRIKHDMFVSLMAMSI